MVAFTYAILREVYLWFLVGGFDVWVFEIKEVFAFLAAGYCVNTRIAVTVQLKYYVIAVKDLI